MKVEILASGSRGNAALVSDGNSVILIDAGLPAGELITRIRAAGVEPKEIAALVLTHAHADHSKSASALSRRFKLEVMANGPTLGVLRERGADGFHRVTSFDTGRNFTAGGFLLTPFPLPHDCAQPVGLVVDGRGARLGVCTDLGFATALVAQRLKGVNMLILEANHDPGMLKDGPYPWHLKQRIRGRKGHLSNDQAAGLLKKLATDDLAAVALGHLSGKNNTPALALGSVGKAISSLERDGSVRLVAASQDEAITISL